MARRPVLSLGGAEIRVRRGDGAADIILGVIRQGRVTELELDRPNADRLIDSIRAEWKYAGFEEYEAGKVASETGRDEPSVARSEETAMSNITIGRYAHESVTKDWSGYIEPEDRSWIIFLDADGKPACYYAEREADGAVTGDGVEL